MRTNWKENVRQAAAALGLATAEQKPEPSTVRQLDIELDDETRLTLTITRGGLLSIQTFRDCSRGERPFWRLAGSSILPADVMREWAENLFIGTRMNSRRGYKVKAA
jgi:hypothetical protein